MEMGFDQINGCGLVNGRYTCLEVADNQPRMWEGFKSWPFHREPEFDKLAGG